MRRFKLSTAVAVGAIATLTAGSAVAASSSLKASSAKACVSKSGTLSLIKNGKCAAHTSKVVIGARGATGKRGVPGKPGNNGVNGNGPAFFVATQTAKFTDAQTATDHTLATLTLPAGSYVVTATGYVSTTMTSGSAFGSCSINRGGTQLAATLFNETAPAEFPIAVVATVTNTDTSPISLHCFESAISTAFSAHGTIVATRVTALSDQTPPE